jgi:hypothetical protein
MQDFDSSRLAALGRVLWWVFAIVLASMLPILAVLILYFVHPTLDRIAITIGFTVFVGLLLIIVTSASVKEVFGTTAAFAAIVVVYRDSRRSQFVYCLLYMSMSGSYSRQLLVPRMEVTRKGGHYS